MSMQSTCLVNSSAARLSKFSVGVETWMKNHERNIVCILPTPCRAPGQGLFQGSASGNHGEPSNQEGWPDGTLYRSTPAARTQPLALAPLRRGSPYEAPPEPERTKLPPCCFAQAFLNGPCLPRRVGVVAPCRAVLHNLFGPVTVGAAGGHSFLAVANAAFSFRWLGSMFSVLSHPTMTCVSSFHIFDGC